MSPQLLLNDWQYRQPPEKPVILASTAGRRKTEGRTGIIMKLKEHFNLSPFDISLPNGPRITNPSIIQVKDGYLVVAREIDPPVQNKSRYLSSNSWVLHYDEHFKLKQWNLVQDEMIRSNFPEVANGLEDGRLFEWNGKQYVLYSGLRKIECNFENTMILTCLENNNLVEGVLLKSPHRFQREKNWMPWICGGALFLVYSTFPMEIYKLTGKGLTLVYEEGRKYPGAIMSGSSQVIPYGKDYLMVTHQRNRAPIIGRIIQKYITRDPEYQLKKIRFSHNLIRMDKEFRIKSISSPFCFEREGIEFCSGIAMHGENILFSYGLLDRHARMIELNPSQVEQLLLTCPPR
jgi:hypothetical protein